MPSHAESQPDSPLDLPAQTRNLGLKQAYVLRLIAYNLAEAIAKLPAASDEDTLRARAQSVASLIRAFAEADERARIARGRPLPGSLRPERKPKATRARKAPRPSTSVEQPLPQSSAPAPSTPETPA